MVPYSEGPSAQRRHPASHLFLVDLQLGREVDEDGEERSVGDEDHPAPHRVRDEAEVGAVEEAHDRVSPPRSRLLQRHARRVRRPGHVPPRTAATALRRETSRVKNQKLLVFAEQLAEESGRVSLIVFCFQI